MQVAYLDGRLQPSTLIMKDDLPYRIKGKLIVKCIFAGVNQQRFFKGQIVGRGISALPFVLEGELI